jgi:hypothetical protein
MKQRNRQLTSRERRTVALQATWATLRPAKLAEPHRLP